MIYLLWHSKATVYTRLSLSLTWVLHRSCSFFTLLSCTARSLPAYAQFTNPQIDTITTNTAQSIGYRSFFIRFVVLVWFECRGRKYCARDYWTQPSSKYTVRANMSMNCEGKCSLIRPHFAEKEYSVVWVVAFNWMSLFCTCEHHNNAEVALTVLFLCHCQSTDAKYW